MAPREEPFSPSHTADEPSRPQPVVWTTPLPAAQTGRDGVLRGWARRSGKGHSRKARETDGKRKGWDKEAQSSQGWRGGRELSGTEGRAVLHCGFQDVPGLRGTVTPADPSECVWTEGQEAGAG